MAENFTTDQFSLRWNNFSNNLTSGFVSHLTDKTLVDVTLAVDGQLLQAHKIVLSVCSPYFKNIFKYNPCHHPVVILKDMGYTEVDALLRFMYQGEVNVRQEDLASFLKVAEILRVKGLTEEDTRDLNSCMDGNDALSLWREMINPDRDTEYGNDIQDVKPSTDSYSMMSGGEHHNPFGQITKYSPKRSRSSVPALKNLVLPPMKNTKCVISMDNDKERGWIDKGTKHFSETNTDLDCPLEDLPEAIFEKPVDPRTDVLLLEKDDPTKMTKLAEDASATVDDPVTYRLSSRGRPQLVHDGYVYNLTSRSQVLNRSHYRCAEQHRGCRGKCAVIAERFMPTGVREHNHPPGYQSEQEYRKKLALDSSDI